MDASGTVDLHATMTTNRLLGLWRLAKGFRLPYLGATLSLGISATSKTLTYLLLRYFIDQVLSPRRYDLLPWIALGFIGLACFEGAFSFASGRLAAQVAEGITRRLRNYLFDHIQRLSFAYHSETPTGELIERCTSDVDSVRRFYAEQAIGAGRIVLLFLINFIGLLSLDGKLAFVSIAILPLTLISSYLFFKRLTKVYEAYQEQEAILSTTLQENLSGVRVVKAFARQDYERFKFEKDNWEKYKRGRQFFTLHSFFWPVSDTLCGFQLLAGYLIGAQMAIRGEISIGTYLAYAGLVIWIIFPLRNLGRLIVQMSTGLVSYQRVAEILKQNREPLEEGQLSPSGNVQGGLVFNGVSFAYEDNNPVIKDISFLCKPGQVVALLGSTGSGKTTLVNLLPRFYEYTGGSITLDGEELNHYPRSYLRKQIGIVEQEPFLFSRSIRENITYGVERQVTDAEVEAAARSAAIHEVIASFPEGYQTMVGEKGVTLSGGQKQRVAIARTLLKDPRILILDDSTSSVDIETEGHIREALENLMRGRTTFIIAHRIQSLMNADLILVFDRGRIVQRGTHTDLLAQTGIYRQIYDIQTRIDLELEEEMSRVSSD
ncbi:MAG: ABC transporter ATP-binding protein [Anaerolineaceae bacterium]|nr:ABC transporter ATP-binding protein [Anaerolineaceae bacterium]